MVENSLTWIQLNSYLNFFAFKQITSATNLSGKSFNFLYLLSFHKPEFNDKLYTFNKKSLLEQLPKGEVLLRINSIKWTGRFFKFKFLEIIRSKNYMNHA